MFPRISNKETVYSMPADW